MIIRHLVLPDFIQNSIDAVNNLYFTAGSDVFISLMSQYSPVYLKNGFERLNRRVTKEEYNRVSDLILNLGFKNGFIQDYIEEDDRYMPDFNEKNMYDIW